MIHTSVWILHVLHSLFCSLFSNSPESCCLHILWMPSFVPNPCYYGTTTIPLCPMNRHCSQSFLYYFTIFIASCTKNPRPWEINTISNSAVAALVFTQPKASLRPTATTCLFGGCCSNEFEMPVRIPVYCSRWIFLLQYCTVNVLFQWPCWTV